MTLAAKLAHVDPLKDPFHDFRNMLFYLFSDSVLGFGEPDELQYRIAEWMQHGPVDEDGIVRQQIQAMRGAGKSVIAACYCAWLFYCNPTIRITVVGSGEKKANEFAGLVKQILDRADLLAHLRPDPGEGVVMRHGKAIRSLYKGRNEVDAFNVRGAGPGKDPSFSAYPVFGGWTGAHPDILIPDDVEIPENSLTVGKRVKLFNKLREGESLVMEGGKLMYMGTPQTEESIYNKLDEAGYTIRRWPAELVDPSDEVRSRNVDPWLLDRVHNGEKPGDPSYPERFPLDRLFKKKALGLAYYNLQMLLDTSLADMERYPLKLRDLIVLDTPADMAPTNVLWGTASRITHIEYSSLSGDCLHSPAFVESAYAPYTEVIMAIDPKGGGADTVAYTVAGFLNGIIYILDAGGFAAGTAGGTSDAVMQKLATRALTFGVKRVIVESNWGGSKHESAYAKLLQPHMAKINGPTQIDLHYVSGQKERRIIDALRPVFEAHRLVLSERAAKCTALTYQITHITPDAGALGHDDEIDTLYACVQHFLPLIVLDPEKQEEQRKQNESLRAAEEWDKWTRTKGPQYGSTPRPMRRQTRRRPARWKKA
jgi:hypothetical protein